MVLYIERSLGLAKLTLVVVRDIPLENMTPLLKSNYATRLLYTIALGFVKTSILVFYVRLDHRKLTRWAIYFLMAFVAALSITTFFFLAFVCVPPYLFWDPEAQTAAPEKCLSQPTQQMFFNLNGICNIMQDVSIYLLPMPMLWNLQMPLRQKLALGALFSVGLVAVAGKYRTILRSDNSLLNPSWMCPFLLRAFPRQRSRYLVLHGRLA